MQAIGFGRHISGDVQDAPGQARDTGDAQDGLWHRGAAFVAGTRLLTEHGLLAVEALVPGDLVRTRDHGLQELRLCGPRTVASEGDLAAVSIPAGIFGHHGALRVAPRHRLYLTGCHEDLYFAPEDGPVSAGELAAAGLLRQDRTGRPVTYHHLLFDRPEVLNTDGLWGACPAAGFGRLVAFSRAKAR